LQAIPLPDEEKTAAQIPLWELIAWNIQLWEAAHAAHQNLQLAQLNQRFCPYLATDARPTDKVAESRFNVLALKLLSC
jgi:hypothetical protein